MSKKNKYYNKKASTPIIKIIPIILVIAILPLIVRAKVINYDSSNLMWYAGDNYQMVDIFNYYKAAILIFSAAIMLITLLYKTYTSKGQLLKERIYAPVGLYLIATVIATFTSISVYFSMTGYINHLENFWVLISYMIVFVYTSSTLSNENELEAIVYAWSGSITLLTLIGLTQFLNSDIYRTDFGLSLIIPSSLQPYINSAEFTLFADNVIYQSLFHYNYVSFYAAMAFPFFITLTIGHTEKRMRYITGIVSAMCFFNLIGSQGRNGFIGLAVGTLISLIFIGRKVVTSKYFWIFTSAIGLISIIFFSFTDTSLESRLKSSFTGVFTDTDYALNSITTEDGGITIDHDDFYIHIVCADEDQYIFFDKDNNAVPLEQNGADITLYSDGSVDNFDNIAIQVMEYNDEDILSIDIDDFTWLFIEIDRSFYYLNNVGNYVTLHNVDSIGFEGNERIGSARGYIWSRTLPLILKNPLFGTGPDTFPLAFPQDDYVGKYQAYESYTPVVDKPHNIYLNYAIHTGLASLFAILAICVLAFVQTFRLHFHKNNVTNTKYHLYAIGTLAAMSGYLVSGIFNDTSLHVTPIFWVLVGLNYASNRLSKRQ